ncbi:MAG: flagellar basal body P-ring protein FlgI [Planctomycetes bacterium]|nr:flagellar basal body P-ring protein FlgI [Planctomycetota bacterium]
MNRKKNRISILIYAGVHSMALILMLGCSTKQEWDDFFRVNQDKGQQPSAAAREVSRSPAIRDTIAPLVTLEGMRLNQVRGFGIVTDLVDTGGRDGPEPVKDYLFKEIQRKQDPSRPGPLPQEFLNSKDVCMVELTGFIPAGAQKGDRFDIAIKSLGSEATSIVGGRLFLGELKVWAETPSGVLSGATLATASGPVFVSPFNRIGKPTDKVDLTTGLVLGGGLVTENRKIRLVLNDPSPSVAKRMERELNSRYEGLKRVAEGERASHVALNIPTEFLNRKWFFLNRVLHTPMNSNSDFIFRRTKELVQAFDEPDPDYESLASALESIGKSALPQMEVLFNSETPGVGFYSSRTGLRLGNRQALEVVTRHAFDEKSEFREQAIEELGWATNQYVAGESLKALLNDADKEIRIRAYRALSRRSHPAISTKLLDRDNVILDVVESTGPFLIYARRSGMPRITIFGREAAVRTPAIFPGERNDGRKFITQLSAQAGDDHLTFIFHNKRNKVNSPPLKAPLNVAELVEFLCDSPRRLNNGEMSGFAVPYSEMLDILSTFCEMQTLPAEFVLEGLEDKEDQESNEREESEY